MSPQCFVVGKLAPFSWLYCRWVDFSNPRNGSWHLHCQCSIMILPRVELFNDVKCFDASPKTKNAIVQMFIPQRVHITVRLERLEQSVNHTFVNGATFRSKSACKKSKFPAPSHFSAQNHCEWPPEAVTMWIYPAAHAARAEVWKHLVHHLLPRCGHAFGGASWVHGISKTGQKITTILLSPAARETWSKQLQKFIEIHR